MKKMTAWIGAALMAGALMVACGGSGKPAVVNPGNDGEMGGGEGGGGEAGGGAYGGGEGMGGGYGDGGGNPCGGY